MIKFTADQPNGVTLLGLGLTKGDLRQLIAGTPVLIKGQSVGIDRDIMIFTGDNEAGILKDLKGFIGPYTQVQVDKKTTH